MVELINALMRAQAEFPTIPKNKTTRGGKFSYKYADLATVMSCVRDPLAKNGLTITQAVNNNSLETRLWHTSGEYLHSQMILPECDDPQTMGSWITYLRRYAVCSLLAVVADEDDDAQVAQNGRQPFAKPQTVQPKAEQKAQVIVCTKQEIFPEASAGSPVVNIQGRYLGKRFDELGVETLLKYVTSGSEWYVKNQKPIPDDWKQFEAEAMAWITLMKGNKNE